MAGGKEERIAVSISMESFKTLQIICDKTLRSRPKQIEYLIAQELKFHHETGNDPKDA